MTVRNWLIDKINIPYSLKFSRIKYFANYFNSAQKQIFTDKVERE